jgi:peptide methionine sulfoxide reductase MsrB
MTELVCRRCNKRFGHIFVNGTNDITIRDVAVCVGCLGEK